MPYTKILKQFFGYDNFRTGQEQLIQEILNKKDTLGIMPTGAGKSLCFQVPALMFSGVTIVISPLISLMKDQVATLKQLNIPAAFINSSLTEFQISLAMSRAKDNKYKIIYVAPERLLTYDFISLANNCEISMIAVDEAHCISKWGQDFRPSYAKIPEFIEKLSTRPVVCAFTATATKAVKEDIVNLLKLNNPYTLTTGFNRENLFFNVLKPKDKFDALIKFLSNNKDKFGIVYCSTKKTVDFVQQSLVSSGYNAQRYHAGLSDFERDKNQDDFIYDKTNIIVATNAFGMGIDKSNVSFVIHYNMPKDIESYYQEAGRAGRDGSDADCIILYAAGDYYINTYLIEHTQVEALVDDDILVNLKNIEFKRLNQMDMYCKFNGCFRSYILNYFGESSDGSCSNCGNCNTDFETLDVTIDAQKILSCVARLNQKYGVKTITDVLTGKKTKKIIQLGFDKVPTFGIINMNESKLNQIIYFLIINNYLIKTDDRYPVLKLGKFAKNILYDKDTIIIKINDDKNEKTPKSKLKTMPQENQLFVILKNLRKSIAQEQKVPPFIIFSDTSLVDMCKKTPTNKDEFALINGVGKYKLEKYSQAFIQAINEYKSI